MHVIVESREMWYYLYEERIGDESKDHLQVEKMLITLDPYQVKQASRSQSLMLTDQELRKISSLLPKYQLLNYGNRPQKFRLHQ